MRAVIRTRREDGMPKVITPAAFGAPMGLYSHGMAAAGEIVVVAGMTGVAPGGALAGPDVESQTKAALENVRAVVEAAGCTMRDVVRLQTFLTSADHIAGFMKARADVFARYFPDRVYPPNTLVIVSALARPDFVVEIEGMAIKAPGKPAPRAAVRAKRPACRRIRR
jgi:2-iminobutanoate/2-iminopropanoate deaminase